MGTPKPLLLYKGEPLYRRLLRLLREVADPVMAAPRDQELAFPAWVRVVADWPGIPGPMGGVLGAMKEAVSSHLLVVGTDFPLLTTEFLAFLIRKAQGARDRGVVPSLAGQWQPLVAVYPVSWFSDLCRWHAQSGSVSLRRFLTENAHRVVAVTEQVYPSLAQRLVNLNTPESYERFVAACSEGNPGE